MSSTDPAASTSSHASRSFSSFKMMTRKRALALKSASAESAANIRSSARRVMRSSRGKPLTEEGAKLVEEERKVREAGVSIIILWGA